MHIHKLNGCAPTPLAHYLKALGTLRLVTEQRDSSARGWWDGECFVLASILDKEALNNFFLESYQPTPLVAPWNSGTGFYPKDKKSGRAVASIESSTDIRLAPFRAAIKDAREVVGGRTLSPDKKEKEAFLRNCNIHWRGGHQRAMAASVVIDGEGSPTYPALLGTGLNDGRLDFSSNYMERLLKLISENSASSRVSRSLLSAALWGEATLQMMKKGAIGQFLPGCAGGANSTNAPDGDALSNPWDFILMLEGAILFTASVTRRSGNANSSRAASPFSVEAQGAGYASADGMDESARGEQWMPLWNRPLTLKELQHLLGEGRSQIGARSANKPLDLARAVAQLGTARGISAFQRYGYIERNGQANLAVPLGRFRVPDHIDPHLACLNDLDAWTARLHRVAKDQQTPARFRLAEHKLTESLFAVTQHPREPSRWQTVLLHLAEMEGIIITGDHSWVGRVPALRSAWIIAADDGSPELRLACAFALQAASFRQDGTPIDPIRRHWYPVKNGETARVMQGRSGIADATALISRRLVEAGIRGERRLPLAPARRASASFADLACFMAGEVDIDRTLMLGRALLALKRSDWAHSPSPPGEAKGDQYPDEAWMVLRLAMLPWPLNDQQIPVDPAIFRRLESGDGGAALEIARRRLRAKGITTTLRAGFVEPYIAKRWAAAMAFPISMQQAKRVLHRIDPKTITEE
ncbi:MAG: type I-U CRISPR-associated protein Csx17 [Sedimenticola sp.]